MQCLCGYNFAGETLAALRSRRAREYASYTVIRDQDYRRFIRRELEAWQCVEKEARLAALARSARYAGCLMVCPRCGRLALLDPKTDELTFYTKEKGTK